MIVEIYLPHGADASVIRSKYPDLEQTCIDDTDCDRYYVGRSSDEEPDEDMKREWLSRNEAIECCGFVEGAVEGAETLIEGNGGWAQGMLKRRDFSSLAMPEEGKRACKRESNRWWRAYRRGKAAAQENTTTSHGGAVG